MEPILITVSDFCRLAGIKKTKAYGLIKNGEVQTAKIGRRTLVTRASLEALIARSIQPAGSNN